MVCGRRVAAKNEGNERVDQNDEPALDDKPQPSGKQSKPEVELSDTTGDLTVAIELLEPGNPLVLNEGFIVTDRPVSINGTKSRVKPRVADEAPLALGSRRE